MTHDPHAAKVLFDQLEALRMTNADGETINPQACIDLLTAALTPLEWSSEKPRVLGYYWYRKHEENEPVLINVYKTLRGDIFGQFTDESKSRYSIQILDGEWAGPITPPLPPPREERR